MRPIAIKRANAERIEAALKDVNGSATSQTVTHYHEVTRAVEEAERKLAVLPKAMWKGVAVTYTPAGPSASSYKYRAITTSLHLDRNTSGWTMKRALREEVMPKEPERCVVFIDRDQADEIKRRSIMGFKVSGGS